MINKLILAFLLLTLGLSAQTGVYHPFPLVDGATWKVRFQDIDCVDMYHTPPQYYTDSKYEYTLTHDTLINGTTYKIVKMGPNISGFLECNPPSFHNVALRQDTAGRKVYLYSIPQQQEYILFDYTLQIGDTLKGYLAQPPYNYDLTVTSIDSVLISNEYRKAINFGAHSLIEGVGSDAGLLEALWYFEGGSNLICMYIPGHPQSGDAECLALDLSSVNEVFPTLNIDIFPNPATNSFTIQLPQAQKFTATLYNLTGQQVGSYVSNQSQLVIQRNNMPAGLYFVRVRIGNNVLSRKIVLE